MTCAYFAPYSTYYKHTALSVASLSLNKLKSTVTCSGHDLPPHHAGVPVTAHKHFASSKNRWA